MKKLEQIEKALKDNFNAEPEIAVSSTWQTDLLARLHQMTPLQNLQAKFERKIWRLTWISFAVSATAAIILGIYFYSSYLDSELDNSIYTDLAMLD